MIPFSPLTVIPAGAGSGKTYALEKTLGQWVRDGHVSPERIVAVTFTEAAAAELARRVRAELLRAGLSEAALRLDRAYVSTIHGFGLRLLQEFAFEAGLTPMARLLDEGEADTLLRRALGRSEKAEPVLSDLRRFGYTWSPWSEMSAEDAFRADILAVMGLLRSLDQGERGDDLLDEAVRWMAGVYGPTDDGTALTDALHEAVTRLLKRFPGSLRGITRNKGPRDTFDKNHRDLTAAHDRTRLERDWALWQSLRTLRQSVRGCPTPDGYDDLADAVMSAADALPRHPGPLVQAATHLGTLVGTARDVLGRHGSAMRAAGLVDFTDMVALSYRLLGLSTEALGTLRRWVDCVVIDEFQDTNPIQFSLLWRLVGAGVPAVVVGDLKQGIMGFQGADPRLFQALMDRHEDAQRPLTANWRSQPALMNIINALGAGLFPETYQPLAPRAPAVETAPLEVLVFAEKPKRDDDIAAGDLQPAHIAAHLRTLLADPSVRVRDLRSKAVRPVRGGDIAILCPTHKHLARQAGWLRAAGLRVRLQEGGWHGGRAVQLALHALDYVADPSDTHAALYMAVTELGSLTLTEGLDCLARGRGLESPVLDALAGVANGAVDRAVGTLVRQTVAALDLFAIVETWPDGAQHRADLVRLLAEADAFDAAPTPTLQGLGLHGRDARVFRAWLGMKVEAGQDGRPLPRVRDEDAIDLVTWHAAKGREWPVVVVGGLERPLSPRLPDLGATYTDFENLDDLLGRARLRWSPALAAPESRQPFADALWPGMEEEARRLLYVAVTRARDRLVLAWPAHATGGTVTTCADVLANACGFSVSDDGVTISSQSFACPVRALPCQDPGLGAAAIDRTGQRLFGLRAIKPRPLPDPTSLSPDSVRPSDDPATASDAPEPVLKRYAAPLTVAPDLPPDARGTVIHRCFEVLPLCDDPVRLAPTLDPPLSGADLTAVHKRVGAFEDWLRARFPERILHREVPVLALDARGSVVNAIIDVLVETPSGAWIIDHKTGVPDDAADAFRSHWPQLDAYALALGQARSDLAVAGLAIHWPLLGVVAEVAGG